MKSLERTSARRPYLCSDGAMDRKELEEKVKLGISYSIGSRLTCDSDMLYRMQQMDSEQIERKL